ncbi:MAG: restriction endonuclease subunit S [Candidatus Saccharicenans sp.]|nr:restriction endonuclease subunit S [Candidatus Saccharicenans sp.]MDH7574240.1 restriction endonuclease subunit S [Candidatus Saccharicenans sp.]
MADKPDIGNLKPYPAYKDSGVPWLGQVPAHWAVVRLGALLRERMEFNDDLRITEVLSVTKHRGVIPYKEKGNIGNKKSDDITRYKIVRPNDIVVNCMNVIIGSVGLSRQTGCLSPVYYVLMQRTENDNILYLNACFQTKPFQESLIRIGNGILAHRMRIPMELLKCEPFPRPAAEEQTGIVRFLDYVDRRIRRVIRARQRRVKLLEEYKQALIHQAVTGQIDVRTGKPYPAYKDSGVEWLGQVPAHWEVRRLKCICRLIYGDALPEASRKDGGVPVYGSNGRVGFHDVSNTHSPCIILGRKGSFGKIQYSDVPVFAIDTTYFVDSINTTVNLRWLFFVLNCVRLDEVSKDSAVPGLDREDAYRCLLPLPPNPEQNAIVEYLNVLTAKIDTVIAASQREIELLREYRERIIADVVTGKVDVREVAAKLPEEPPEEIELMEEDELAESKEENREEGDGFTEEISEEDDR